MFNSSIASDKLPALHKVIYFVKSLNDILVQVFNAIL